MQLPLERESAFVWELSFVVPSNHGFPSSFNNILSFSSDSVFFLLLNLLAIVLLFLFAIENVEFKFLLKPKDSDGNGNTLCIIEEGTSRLFKRGALHGDARMAVFKLNTYADGGDQDVLDYIVVIKADRVSPFDLAASWRAYHENLRPSTVRGIPDVSINAVADPNEVSITIS